MRKRIAIPTATLLLLTLGTVSPMIAGAPTQQICTVLLHEETVELADAELQVAVAQAGFEAYERVFKLIEGLWDAEAIDRMTYLRAKYDRDAARLSLERADLILARQAALIDHQRLACAKDGNAEARAAALDRYLRADCSAQTKATEVADTNLIFNRAWLASIRDLRENAVATRQDVILAELDVEQESLRLGDAKQRSERCRRELGIETED